jgi:hypothetical protein
LLEKYHGLNYDFEGPVCLSLSVRISQPFSSVFSHNKSASSAAAVETISRTGPSFFILPFHTTTSRQGLTTVILGPCLDTPQKLEFFHSLSITSIFGPMHEVINVGKKTNYTV